MKINIEIRIDIEGQSWAMRIDGHEWEQGLTSTEVQRNVATHVSATMDCLIAEEIGEAETC